MHFGWKSLFGGAAIATLSLLACSSSDDTNAATPDAGKTTTSPDGGHTENTSEAGAANQAQACKTLPRNFAVAPKDYYFVYEDAAAAVKDMRGFIPSKTYLDADNPFQARGEAAAAKAYAGYQKLYPTLVAGLPGPPQVIVEDNDEWNAYAYGGPIFNGVNGAPPTAPWIFVYNKGFFVNGITDDEIAMVTAHELGHLILRNADADDFSDIFYRETPDEQGKIYGEYETNDPAVADLAGRVQVSGDRVGLLVAPELHGIPTPIGAHIPDNAFVQQPLYERLIDVIYLNEKASSPHPDDCPAALAAHDQFLELIGQHITVDEKLDLGTDGPAIDAAALDYQAKALSCLSHVTGTFVAALELLKKTEDPNYDATRAAIGDDQQKLADYLGITSSEIAADNASPNENPVQKIFDLGTAQMTGLASVFADPTIQYAQLRDYTKEDDADEAAVRVAKLMNVDADQLVNGIFLGRGPSFASAATACHALLASGGAPEYGGAGDPHHGDCWRAYRNTKLKAALQSCGTGWPATP